jgi:hypothetical protein
MQHDAAAHDYTGMYVEADLSNPIVAFHTRLYDPTGSLSP